MPEFGDTDLETTTGRYAGYGQVDPLAPSVANGQISQAEWDAYKKKRRRAAIFGTLGVLGAATGLGAAGMAMGGATGAAAGGVQAAPSFAPLAGGAPWAVTPLAAPVTASGVGAATGGAATAATGAATGGKMALGSKGQLALSAVSGLLKGWLGNRSRNKNDQKNRDHELELARMNDSRARDLADLEVLNDESMANPFRDSLAQLEAALYMDRIAKYKPLTFNPTGGQIGRYSVPSSEGGWLNYEADPELLAAAALSRSNVLQGKGQSPSVVTRTAPPVGQPGAPNPRSGALNLLAGRPPAQTPVSTTMPVSSPLPAGAGVSFDPTALPPGQPTAPDDFRLSLDDLMAPPAPSRQAPRRRRRMAA